MCAIVCRRSQSTSPRREIVSKASTTEACNGTNVWRIYLLMVNSALTQCSVALAHCTRATYFAMCTIDHERLFVGLRSTRVMNRKSQNRREKKLCEFTLRHLQHRSHVFSLDNFICDAFICDGIHSLYLMMKKNMSIETVLCASECVRASKIDYKRSGIKSVSSIY